MLNFQDQGYLTSEQYKDAGNLNARIQLHQRFSTNPYGWFRWVFDQLCVPSDANILEIGCGLGTLWLENMDRIPADWIITLSDLSPVLLHKAQVNFASIGKEFLYDVIDAVEIPFPADAFDAVIADHMLYLIQDRQSVLAEIARVLKPNGYLYAATNGENHLSELSKIIVLFPQLAEKYNSPDFSADEFTLENGMQQLEPWFKHIKIRKYEDSLMVTEAEPLLAYIYSMIPRSDDPTINKQYSDLQLSINKLISQQGCIYIQKSTGIFIVDNRC
jgi:ubiquinone/menaquinone biosynthesis C-methylase UbiE